jgi:soluble cytochrome b562
MLATARGGGMDEAKSAEEDLYDLMLGLEDGMKVLRRALRDPEKNPSSLDHIDAMQRAALAAKTQQPPMLESVPGEQQGELLTKFRKRMVQLLQALLNLEMAVLDGDNEAAQKIYKTLSELEEQGHDEFVEE